MAKSVNFLGCLINSAGPKIRVSCAGIFFLESTNPRKALSEIRASAISWFSFVLSNDKYVEQWR